MLSVRARLAAFAPLVVLALLTGAAAVTGYRTSDVPPASATAPTQGSASPSAAPTSTDPGPFVPLPSLTPLQATEPRVSIGQAQQAWDDSLDKLVDAGSGTYSWAVYYGADPDPLQSETGSFDLDPIQSRFDRTIPTRDGKKQVVHVRRIAQTTYMQFDDWGSWSGCWARVTNDQIERATGLDLSGTLPLPVTVVAITDALVSKPSGFWFGPPYREYSATVSAAEALAFLGFNGAAFVEHLDRLSRITVPVTISLDARGRFHGGGAHGSQVAAAIAKSAPKLLTDVLENLPRFRAAFAVTGVGSPVSVPPPPPRSILPFGAESDDTCDAQGPRA